MKELEHRMDEDFFFFMTCNTHFQQERWCYAIHVYIENLPLTPEETGQWRILTTRNIPGYTASTTTKFELIPYSSLGVHWQQTDRLSWLDLYNIQTHTYIWVRCVLHNLNSEEKLALTHLRGFLGELTFWMQWFVFLYLGSLLELQGRHSIECHRQKEVQVKRNCFLSLI